MNKKELEGFIKSFILYIVSAFGISLTIKANIGVSSFNAMNVAIADASNIKVGTITTCFNLAFLLYYMYLTGFKHKVRYLLQIAFVFMFGTFINLFTYGLMGSWVISGYPLKVLIITLGTIIGGTTVGMIVNYNSITFPIEGVCAELAENTRHSFTKLRYSVDIISIAVSLGASLLFQLPLYVREGTLISLLLFSFTMGHVKRIHGAYMSNAVEPVLSVQDELAA